MNNECSIIALLKIKPAMYLYPVNPVLFYLARNENKPLFIREVLGF
jgi:hypothetical protein